MHSSRALQELISIIETDRVVSIFVKPEKTITGAGSKAEAHRWFLNLLVLIALGAAYFAAGKLGLKLALVHVSATAVWPPTGIALAAFLTLGYRVWPAIFVGAFLVNLTTAGTVATSIGIAAGNTLESLIGAYLVNRFSHGAKTFDRPQDTFKFAALAALLSTAVSPNAGPYQPFSGRFCQMVGLRIDLADVVAGRCLRRPYRSSSVASVGLASPITLEAGSILRGHHFASGHRFSLRDHVR